MKKVGVNTARKPKASRAQMESCTPRSKGKMGRQNPTYAAPKGYALKRKGG